MKDFKKANFGIEKMSKEWLFFNKNSLKKSTLQTYEYLLEKHIENSALADKPIYKISAEEIVGYSETLLEKGLSPKTVNCVLLIIHSIFKYAKTLYGITPPYIKYVRDTKRETRVLTPLEQNRLELYLKRDTDIFKLGMLFALYTGVRIGELCALKWGDINDGTVKICKTMRRLKNSDGKSVVMLDKPKTESSNRTIPLPDFLAKYVENLRKTDEEFFLSNNKLDKIEPRLMQKKFTKLTEELKLGGATFHTLRHTFATRCIECGFDAKTLSEILGHSDVKTTLNRYVHCSLELKRNSMNLLSRIAV